MVQPYQFDPDTVREELSKMEPIFEGQSNEDLADTVLALLEGKIQFKDIQGLSDDNMEAVYTVAYNAVQAGQFEKGEKMFRFLSLFDNSQEKYWNGLGLCLFNQNNYDGALQAYSISAMLNIDDPYAPMRLAECHLALGDAETAAGALEVALEIAGDKPQHADAKKHAQALLDLLQSKK